MTSVTRVTLLFVLDRVITHQGCYYSMHVLKYITLFSCKPWCCFLHFLGLLPPTRSLSLCIFAALSVCCSVLFVDRIAPTQVKITYNFIATFASKLLAFSLSVLVLLFLRYPFSFYPSKANHCLVYGQSWFHKLRYNLGFGLFCFALVFLVFDLILSYCDPFFSFLCWVVFPFE